MAVRAEFRRQGIGRAMLAAVDAHAGGIYGVSRVCLHVEACNLSALRIYTAAGFREARIDDSGAAYLDRCAAADGARWSGPRRDRHAVACRAARGAPRRRRAAAASGLEGRVRADRRHRVGSGQADARVFSAAGH